MLPKFIPTGSLTLVIVLFAAVSCLSQTFTAFTGKVVGIADGDTITVLDRDKKQHKIRLAGIDAPEIGQPFGQAAKKKLSDLVFEKMVTVVGTKTDRYGRLVAQVFLLGVNVPLEMLNAGLAWHFKEYEGEQLAKERKAYSEAESKAKESKLNLWAETRPMPPWEYRNGQTLTEARKLTDFPLGALEIVGNRNSKIYHWNPGCPDFNKIAEKNRVPFKSMAEAEAAGYRAAMNCKHFDLVDFFY